MSRKKPAPHLMRGGYRFSEKDVRKCGNLERIPVGMRSSDVGFYGRYKAALVRGIFIAMIIGRPKFVLASGSPRRLTLINQIGIEPDALRPADIDETPKRGELPRACANRLARGKAEAALAAVKLDDELTGSFILSADTVVAVGRRILPKADLLDEAAQCLRLLSGRSHRVHTGICLVTPKEAFRQRLIETRVRFKRLTENDIEAYLASGEWRGKAGGYAAQGLAGSFIVKIVGSYTNIVGLPLYETATLLSGEGFPIHFGWLNAV